MTKIIDGATQLLGILGDPVKQVRAPEVWTALFRDTGQNAMCVPLHVAPANLAATIATLRAIKNMPWLILTIPHKPAGARLADHLTERASLVKSVNCMRRETDGTWTGDILDGVGFVEGLRANGQRIAGRRALVVGSGGVGTAIAFAFVEAGAASVHVADIDATRAEALAHRLQAAGTASGVAKAVAKGFDLVVNASPLGMQPCDPTPIDLTGLASDAIVGDVVVHPRMTPLLVEAQRRGCHIQPGTVMMDHQLQAMGDFFRLPPGDYGPAAIARVTAAPST